MSRRETSTASRETLAFTAYEMGPKRCTACNRYKPRITFMKRSNGSYSDRCYSCRIDGRRAKPVKGGRRS